MTKKRPRDVSDDIGFDEQGQPFTLGESAAARNRRILDDPAHTPVLLVAELHGELAVRVYGDPSEKLADLLDHVARTYRKAVTASQGPPQ